MRKMATVLALTAMLILCGMMQAGEMDGPEQIYEDKKNELSLAFYWTDIYEFLRGDSRVLLGTELIVHDKNFVIWRVMRYESDGENLSREEWPILLVVVLGNTAYVQNDYKFFEKVKGPIRKLFLAMAEHRLTMPGEALVPWGWEMLAKR